VVAWYNRRFEIENLKAVLRAIHYQVDAKRARAALIPIEDSRTRWEQLFEAASIGAVIERLHGSPYARPLENAMERYQQERRLFPLEIALDLFYFQRLVRLMESLNRKEAAGARRFLGRSIAIQNLLWAYRYRIYGRMTPEQIINYTLHRAFEAGLDTVRRIALGAPLAVEAGRFGFEVPSGLPEVEALAEIEIQAGRELWRHAIAALSRPLFDLGGVLAYLWLLDAEVRDLMIVVEGKAMGLSGPQIARRMVRTV
jgi:V/A-type H+/Na+-transporting ATPase subunit C